MSQHWAERLVMAYAESEAPPKFFYWSGLASIAAVTRKNIFLDRHDYKLYPNIYAFLIAASGMKKGVPINVARELVNAVNCTRVISGRNSIQQVLADLSKLYQTKEEILRVAHGIMLSGELAAFLTKDPDSLTILTDLHDTHYNEKEWKYSLKSGMSRLVQPCITILGATNEDHFDEAVPPQQISGGFIARTFIVYSAVPGNYNSLTKKPSRIVQLRDFVPYLEEVSRLKGEMIWTDKAIQRYDDWYYPHAKEIGDDKTGTLRRLGDQVLKAAMLISLSSDTSMELREEHIDEAIVECKYCANSVKRVTSGGSGKGIMTKPLTIILRELLKAEKHELTRSSFLKKFWVEGYTSTEFDVSMETYIQSHAVIADGIAGSAGLKYILSESTLAEYNKNERKIREG